MGQGRFGTTPSRRRQQDLAGPLQLPDCTLQRLGPGLIVARHPGSLPGLHFRAGHPPRSVSGLTPTRVPIRLTAAVTGLGVAAIGQRDMGEVGLPALVRQVALDPDPGPLGPVARVRVILRRGSGPPDRRHAGRGVHLVGEDGGDRVRAGVAASSHQLQTEARRRPDRMGGATAAGHQHDVVPSHPLPLSFRHGSP